MTSQCLSIASRGTSPTISDGFTNFPFLEGTNIESSLIDRFDVGWEPDKGDRWSEYDYDMGECYYRGMSDDDHPDDANPAEGKARKNRRQFEYPY